MTLLGERWIARRKRHAGPRTLWPWPYLGLVLFFLYWLYYAVNLHPEGGWALLIVVAVVVWGPFILALGAFPVSRIAALRQRPWRVVFVLSGAVIVLAVAWGVWETFLSFASYGPEEPHEARGAMAALAMSLVPFIGLLALCLEWARLAAWLRKHLQEPAESQVS
jgi:hypothetical protein